MSKICVNLFKTVMGVKVCKHACLHGCKDGCKHGCTYGCKHKYIFVKMDEKIVLHVAVNIGLNRCVQTC